MGNNVTEFCIAESKLFSCLEMLDKIILAKAEILYIESWRVLAPCSYGIGLCEQVAPLPVGNDQVHDLEFIGV